MTAPTRTGRTAGEGTLILVVDDDPRMRRVIRWALEDEGLHVETAMDGQEALDVARKHPPSLAVLDITLPVMHSYDVAPALRAVTSEALPILAISADGHIEEKAQRVGAFAYVRKPFEMSEFLAAVRQGLDGR